MPVTRPERKIIRDLAKKVADIAALPVMEERRNLWRKHNALKPCRPMMLIFPEGSWRELLPAESLRCPSKEGRAIELDLRRRIYTHEHFHDDTVCEDLVVVGRAITSTGWGVDPHWKPATEVHGARGFDPIIRTPADLKKLRIPEYSVDDDASQARLTEMQELLGDILRVELRGARYFGVHIMNLYTALRGLDQVMMDMVENPSMLHDAMAFYESAFQSQIRQYAAMDLFSLNNDNTYHSSGGVGWSDELPKRGCDPDHVRPCDMWASAEAQEMALVSPDMHEEFILAYERRILSHFGLNGYGCCEDLTRKLDYVFAIPNIRRISISPFANVDACAEKMKNRAIFSWKPHPSHLVGQFNTRLIRDYIAHTLDVCAANRCVLELVLKDTHTCDHHPERFTEWTKIARELIQERTGGK